MHPLVGPAEGTNLLLNPPDKAVGQALLLTAGLATDRTGFADPGHGPVKACDLGFTHVRSLLISGESSTLTADLRHIPLFLVVRQPIRATISVATRHTAWYQVQFNFSE
jgi:hypothetical protein